MAQIRWYWEDLLPGTVRELGSITPTAEDTKAFARQFDPQPFHLDEEAGRQSVFGALSASGWHTCALAMRMMCDAYLLEAASLGSPGLDNIRWLKPVYAGDTISVRLKVLDARPMASKPHVGLMLSRWEVFNQRGETVMTMEGWGMFGRREVAPPVGENPR